VSISQQGSGFPFLSWTAFNYLCDDNTMNLEVAIEDIPLTNARNFLEKVSICTFSELSIHDTMFEPFIFNNFGSLA